MREKLIHLLIIVGFGALFYANSFGNFFVWNDWTLIIENFLVKDWRNLPEIFTSAFWKPLVGEPSQIYRPLVFLSLMADFAIWGLDPWGYHLTNTSLHVLNSVLVYFLMRVYVSPITALMGSVLFAAHPIHTEAVTYISGRGEILMAFFLLSGTLLFLQSAKRSSRSLYFASLPLFFFSLLAKETAVIFPLLLIAADLTAHPVSSRGEIPRRLVRQIGPLVALGIYFILREFFVGLTLVAYGSSFPDFVHHFLLVLKAVPLYVGLLLLPLNLHFIHQLASSGSPVDIQILLSIFLLVGAGWGLRYAVRSGDQAAAFALLWYLIGLLPLVHFTGLNLPFLEGWIYLPSLGLLLLAALSLDKLKRWTSSGAVLLLTLWIAVMLGGITFYRNWDWKNDMQLSLHTIAASPDNPIALRMVGNARMRRGKTFEAEKIFKKGLMLAPTDPGLHRSLGALYRFMERGPEALAHFGQALKHKSEGPYSHWLLGHYYLRRGKLPEAEKYFSEAVRIFPYSSEIHHDLAHAYYLQGKPNAAEAELRRGLEISPYSPVLKENLETVLKKRGL